MFNRRDFIKFMSLMGGVVLNPFQRFGNWSGLAADMIQEPIEGELYAGFVLLPYEAPIPSFVTKVQYPAIGALSQVENQESTLNGYIVNSYTFDNINSLREFIGFPIFIPGLMLDGMDFLEGYIQRFSKSGEIWEVRMYFGLQDIIEPQISISAQPIFPKPYPVWPDIAYPHKELGDLILDEEYYLKEPQKVDFLPQRGLMVTSDRGCMLQWIIYDILYTTSVDYIGWLNNAETFGKSLVKL